MNENEIKQVANSLISKAVNTLVSFNEAQIEKHIRDFELRAFSEADRSDIAIAVSEMLHGRETGNAAQMDTEERAKIADRIYADAVNVGYLSNLEAHVAAVELPAYQEADRFEIAVALAVKLHEHANNGSHCVPRALSVVKMTGMDVSEVVERMYASPTKEQVEKAVKFILSKDKAFVVGRHVGELPGLTVVGQKNITFSLDINEVFVRLRAVAKEAQEAGAGSLVFQNTPGIVTAALLSMACAIDDSWVRPLYPMRVGIIISRQPEVRPAGVKRTFVNSEGLEEALRFANPRAKITQVGVLLEVELDPVIPFEFDHVEWL